MSSFKVFISYRREDSSYATRFIYERLAAHFGSEAVFLDQEKIPPGVDFREYLNNALSQCAVLLTVIGDRWLHSREPGKDGRRLDNPRDLVAMEIRAALERNIPIIPVLVENATMPTEEELPSGLQDLAFRQAAEVRSSDFYAHLDRLIQALESFRGPLVEPKTVQIHGENQKMFFLRPDEKDDEQPEDPTEPMFLPPGLPLELKAEDREQVFSALFSYRLLLLSSPESKTAIETACSLIFNWRLDEYEKRILFLSRSSPREREDSAIDLFVHARWLKVRQVFLIEIERRGHFLDSVLCISHLQAHSIMENLRQRDCFVICTVNSENLSLDAKQMALLPFFHWPCPS
ncbi:MAG TPA: toll/interleukin-1 receptor domain-containing protein [Thermoanaerobaculia bacterium]